MQFNRRDGTWADTGAATVALLRSEFGTGNPARSGAKAYGGLFTLLSATAADHAIEGQAVVFDGGFKVPGRAF